MVYSNILEGILRPSQAFDLIFDEEYWKELTVYWITNTSHAEPLPIHPFYKKNFNAVDLHDKQWYIIPWGFRINHWRIKMFIGQQKSALLNSWTLFNEFQRLPLIDFRLAIITHLLSANSD